MNTTLQNENNHPIYDVIIAGGGPVGLFLACELALAKCSVLLLEKAEDPQSPLKQLPFGIRGLSAPTIEALYRRNLFKELTIHQHLKNPHQNAVQGPHRQVGHFAGIPFHEGDVDTSQWKYRLPSSTPTALISEMQELETIFYNRAVSLGVAIKYGHAVSSYQQSADGVAVQSGTQFFRGKWLVGCDGARSAVRKLGGFEFAGTEPEFTGYTLRADLLDPEKLQPGRNVTPRGMYMQSQPGYFALQDFDAGAFHQSKKPITLEYLQEVLRRISATDVTIAALHIATSWTDRARQATAYRNGRVLLAGDAAHIHSPLGGQGLNLGLGDAMNLGWKLASVIQGQAAESLLDSYHTERHLIGAQVLDWSRAQVAIMRPNPHSQALHAIFRDVMNTRDGATYVAARVWGINMQYDLGGHHPLIGRSMPNFELGDGTMAGELMYHGQGLLIDFNANASLRPLINRYADQIRYVAGPAKDQLGLNALLVRPDGMVAWLADGEPDVNELEKVLNQWFGD